MIIFKEAIGIEWRKWFAWRPVKTEKAEWVWFEMVERKIYNCPCPIVTPSDWIIYRKKIT